jgi:hypothetical protein
LSYGQEDEQKVDNHEFNESPKSEIFQWGLETINLCCFSFSMLEEILIFRGQEGIEIFWKKFTKSEFDGDLMEVLCHMIKRKNL